MSRPSALLMTFQAVQGMEGRLSRLLVPFAREVVEQPGCVQATVERSVQNQLAYVFQMRWDSMDSLVGYLSLPPFMNLWQIAEKLTKGNQGIVLSLVVANFEPVASLVEELEQDIDSEVPRGKKRRRHDDEDVD